LNIKKGVDLIYIFLYNLIVINMKNKFMKNIKIIIITLSLLLFFIILRDVFKYEVTSYDSFAYQVFVEDLRSDEMTLVMKIITSLGGALVIAGIIILLFALNKNKKYSYFATINIVIVFLLNSLIKFIIQRPRPSGYNLITENYYSFPSGHSMVSTAFYGFLIYLVYKDIKNKRLKYFLITLLFFMIVLIMISRIYLGVHYLSDTLGGFTISISYLMILITIIEKYKLLEEKK